jgi:hypothetical protein
LNNLVLVTVCLCHNGQGGTSGGGHHQLQEHLGCPPSPLHVTVRSPPASNPGRNSQEVIQHHLQGVVRKVGHANYGTCRRRNIAANCWQQLYLFGFCECTTIPFSLRWGSRTKSTDVVHIN